MTAMAPSPVTLQAVPKLSIAIYSAIMRAYAVSSMPNAAIIAPPGTPGAATIVMPSMSMNPLKSVVFTGMPLIIIIAIAHAVIFIVLPDRCMVAHKGITKVAMFLPTPFLMV